MLKVANTFLIERCPHCRGNLLREPTGSVERLDSGPYRDHCLLCPWERYPGQAEIREQTRREIAALRERRYKHLVPGSA